MISEEPLKHLHTIDGYRRQFMDIKLWQPFVETICRRHDLLPCESVRCGLEGSCPTFIVNDRWVVKLFGYLFDGEASFSTERQAYDLIAGDPTIPVPELIGAGSLFEKSTDWPWPYLIFSFVPGISIGEVYEKVEADEHIRLAGHLGVILRRLHLLPLGEEPPLSNTWKHYRTFLQHQFDTCYSRHRAWATLPNHLLEQLHTYLLPPDPLINYAGEPHLIHADLTADHVLGRAEGNRWSTLALIDFGDAMVASLPYELVALHLDLFRCNKLLLRSFLDSYGLNPAQRKLLPHHAMCAALLHRFNVLENIFGTNSPVRAIASLEELATLLWDTDSPSQVEQ